MLYHLSVGIKQVELHAAKLCALTTVGTTSEALLRRIALSAVAHAEGTMHEDLKLYIGNAAVDGSYFIHRQLPGQHHTPEALCGQPSHLLDRAVVRLGRCVHAEPQCWMLPDIVGHRHVLYQNGIGTGIPQFA